MCPKSPGTTQIYLILGGGLLSGVCIVLESDWSGSRSLWKTTRRDRARVCVIFERPCRFRASSMNQKKRPAKPEASAAIQASIKRSLDPPTALTANEGPVRIQYKCLAPIYVFPEMKLCSLLISKTELLCSVSQFLHSYVCERFIYFQDQSAYSALGKYVDRYWEYINRSQTHECGNWDCGRAISRKGIQKWDFRCSASPSKEMTHNIWQVLITKQWYRFTLSFLFIFNKESLGVWEKVWYRCRL